MTQHDHDPEACDCPECRIRYRQGRSLASEEASTSTVGWTILFLALTISVTAGWVWLLT